MTAGQVPLRKVARLEGMVKEEPVEKTETPVDPWYYKIPVYRRRTRDTRAPRTKSAPGQVRGVGDSANNNYSAFEEGDTSICTESGTEEPGRTGEADERAGGGTEEGQAPASPGVPLPYPRESTL